MDKVIKRTVPIVGIALLTTQDVVATGDIAIGPRYHNLMAEIIATAANNKVLGVADMCGLINLKIGGRVQRAHTAAELDYIYSQYGDKFRCKMYNYDGGTLHYVGANYTGGVGLATQRIVGAGANDLTVTPTIVNGVMTAVAVVAGGTAYKVGDTFTPIDSTGTGSFCTVLTINAGAVLTASVTNPATLVLQGPVAGKQTIMYVPLHFTEPWRGSYAARQSFAWPTQWADGSVLPSFQIEFTIPKATANINSASPYSITLWSQTDTQLGGLDANKMPVKNIVRWARKNEVYTGAGDLYLVDSSPSDVELERTFFCQAGDDVTNCRVLVDSREVRNYTKNVNDQTLIQNDWNQTALNPDIFTLCYDYSDIPTDGLVLSANGVAVKDYQIILTIGAAAAATKLIATVSQKYGPLQ